MQPDSKKRTKKVVLYSTITVITALIITIICMASVMVQFFPTVTVAGKKINVINLNNSEGVNIYDGTVDSGQFSTDWVTEKGFDYSKLQTLFEKSFKASFFTGSTEGASKKYELERPSTNIGAVTQANTFCLYYRFGDSQTRLLYNSEGTVEKISQLEQKIYGIMIAISSENNSFGEVSIYFCTSPSDRNSLSYELKTHANYKKLLTLLEDWKENER